MGADHRPEEVELVHHFRYLRQLLRHKWHVFKWCCLLGIPFLGLLHDNSKFRPSEWFAHARYFGRDRRNIRSRVELDRAWNAHLNRNKHHWQYWVAIPDGPEAVCTVDMPQRYRLEMLADWLDRAEHRDGLPLREWYRQQDMIFHPQTRRWVERKIRLWDIKGELIKRVG